MEINGVEVQEIYYYKDMGLSEATMKALDKKGYAQATAIQGGAIPYFMVKELHKVTRMHNAAVWTEIT